MLSTKARWIALLAATVLLIGEGASLRGSNDIAPAILSPSTKAVSRDALQEPEPQVGRVETLANLDTSDSTLADDHDRKGSPLSPPTPTNNQALAGAWLRIESPAADEPYIPTYAEAIKAELRPELEKLSFDEIGEALKKRQYKSKQAISHALQIKRREGRYDILSTEGIHGSWGEELLPEHYQGSHWKAWDLGNGTAELTRLSPLEYDAVYVERYAVNILRELRSAAHNRYKPTQKELALSAIAEMEAAGLEPTWALKNQAGLID